MEVFVRGSRSSTQDWLRAQQIPANELPPLSEEQKTEARLTHRSEVDFARSAYAGHLTQEELLQKMLRFGKWLNARIEERNPGTSIDSIDLDTWSEKLRVRGQAGEEQFSFDLDEAVVERFLLTGSADLENSILRVFEIFAPLQRAARAS